MDDFPLVHVPNVLGKGRFDAEQTLAAVPLRYIARTVTSTSPTGASWQSPAAGQTVLAYSVVTVEYPNPIATPGEGPVDGPQPKFGPLEGVITYVYVGKEGANIGLSVQGRIPFFYRLYSDNDPASREVYMRRGAMLAIAQRAFTGQDLVRVDFAGTTVESIQIFRPVVEQPFPFP
jgi:PASTA domain